VAQYGFLITRVQCNQKLAETISLVWLSIDAKYRPVTSAVAAVSTDSNDG
jgi:hypothetical protein